MEDALAALRDGDSVLVDVATADGAAFLNTASTGVYVDLVKAREKLEPTVGKWPAMLVGARRRAAHEQAGRPDRERPPPPGLAAFRRQLPV